MAIIISYEEGNAPSDTRNRLPSDELEAAVASSACPMDLRSAQTSWLGNVAITPTSGHRAQLRRFRILPPHR